MEKIVSMKNQKVKQWKKLQTTKGRKEARAYLIEGTHLLKEAIKANAIIQEVVMTEAFHQQSDLPIAEGTSSSFPGNPRQLGPDRDAARSRCDR
jgi:TrmH family RNA methyltransferase